jgi:hypothetical protein
MLEVVELPDRPVGDIIEEPLVGAVDDPPVEGLRPDIERQEGEDLDVVAVVGEFGERRKPEPGGFLPIPVVVDGEVDVGPRSRPAFGNRAVEDDDRTFSNPSTVLMRSSACRTSCSAVLIPNLPRPEMASLS